MGKTVADLLVVLFFILVNAFFSGTEMAVITLNDAKIRKQAEEGDKKSRKVLKFLDNTLRERLHRSSILPERKRGRYLSVPCSSRWCFHIFR